MRHLLRIFPVLFLIPALVHPAAAAETKAVQTMAGILLKLNHFPSDDKKKTLQQIAEDKTATAHERTLAQALTNLKHKVSAEDKPKLEAVLKDQSAPESVRTLATILMNLNHTPTDADKEKLKKLSASSS